MHNPSNGIARFAPLGLLYFYGVSADKKKEELYRNGIHL
jgi:hypothetical protein